MFLLHHKDWNFDNNYNNNNIYIYDNKTNVITNNRINIKMTKNEYDNNVIDHINHSSNIDNNNNSDSNYNNSNNNCNKALNIFIDKLPQCQNHIKDYSSLSSNNNNNNNKSFPAIICFPLNPKPHQLNNSNNSNNNEESPDETNLNRKLFFIWANNNYNNNNNNNSSSNNNDNYNKLNNK